MNHELVFEIDEEGAEVTVEVSGLAGRECLQTTQFFEEALGKVTDREHTREYYLRKAGLYTRLKSTHGKQ